MTEPINIHPGTRTLLPTETFGSIPAHIADPLLALGRACNDAGAIVASAYLDRSRVLDRQQRLEQDRAQPHSVEIDTAELLWEASIDHIERVGAIYAAVASRYVTAAVEAASHAISRRPVRVPDVDTVDVADILLLAEIHIPLIQLDEAAFSPRKQRRARGENAALRAAHEALQQASAATIAYDDAELADGTRRFIPGPELGGALHEYACMCAMALAVALTAAQPDD
jgi:hypothetical protein